MREGYFTSASVQSKVGKDGGAGRGNRWAPGDRWQRALEPPLSHPSPLLRVTLGRYGASSVT